MKTFLAIVIYKCSINGEKSDSIDFQVKYYSSETDAEVKSKIMTEEPLSYKNELGENVIWEFKEIMSIDEFNTPKNQGEEVAGFIIDYNELKKMV